MEFRTGRAFRTCAPGSADLRRTCAFSRRVTLYPYMPDLPRKGRRAIYSVRATIYPIQVSSGGALYRQPPHRAAFCLCTTYGGKHAYLTRPRLGHPDGGRQVLGRTLFLGSLTRFLPRDTARPRPPACILSVPA